jgi:ketosteroid isomerase-like protein
VSTSTSVSTDLEKFMDDLHDRLRGHATRSDTEPFLELWSHSPDASIMAAVGGYHIGFDEVSRLLRWVSRRLRSDTYSARTLLTHEGVDFAASVGLEDYTSSGDGPDMTLRVTHVYRREDGGWKLLHRHAEQLQPVDEALPMLPAN